MKHARGAAAGDEVDFALVENSEAGIARGESAFAGKRCGHRVARQFFPVLAIGGADEHEFPVNGIAEREALRFGDAGERVEKKLLARAGKFELPGFAAVVSLVDARHVSRAAGHHVGQLFIEGLDSAQVERMRLHGVDEPARVVFAAVRRSQRAAIRPRSPDHRRRMALRIARVSGGDGAQIRIPAAGLDGPELSRGGRNKKNHKQKGSHGGAFYQQFRLPVKGGN